MRSSSPPTTSPRWRHAAAACRPISRSPKPRSASASSALALRVHREARERRIFTIRTRLARPATNKCLWPAFIVETEPQPTRMVSNDALKASWDRLGRATTLEFSRSSRSRGSARTKRPSTMLGRIRGAASRPSSPRHGGLSQAGGTTFLRCCHERAVREGAGSQRIEVGLCPSSPRDRRDDDRRRGRPSIAGEVVEIAGAKRRSCSWRYKSSPIP
jgi:hypothetical protein